jgi:F0F1-type ATP synthase membrane subunit c/vacuolar-type H+-ATPase subunit K
MRHPTARILWIALLASQVVYLAVAFIVRPAGQPLPSLAVSRLFFTLAALAVVTAVGSMLYRRKALVAPIQAGRLDPNHADGFAQAFAPFVLGLVLAESIAIYGLVLALLSHEPSFALPFALLAFVLTGLQRPSAPDLVPQATAGVFRPPPLA